MSDKQKVARAIKGTSRLEEEQLGRYRTASGSDRSLVLF